MPTTVPLYAAFNNVFRCFAVEEDTGRTELYYQIRPEYLDRYGFSLNDTDPTRYEDAFVRRYKPDNPGLENQVIKPLDIILQIVGAVGNIGLVDRKLDRNWIAPQTMAVLRFHDPENRFEELVTLFLFLRDKGTRRALRSFAKPGRAGLTLPVKALRQFQILKLEPRWQKKAANIFERQLEIKKLQNLDAEVPW